MRVRLLIRPSTNSSDLCRQALHGGEVARCKSAHIRRYRRSRETCCNDCGRYLGWDSGSEAIGEHRDIYGRANRADGAADGTGHPNRGTDFLLVFNFDAGVGETHGFIPADEKAAERHEHDRSVLGIRCARGHCPQERAAHGEDEDALQLGLSYGHGEAAANYLAGHNECAGNTIQPAGIHGGSAVVGVQNSDHGRPDDGHGVVDTGS